ncbi:sugar-binding domain-containing protein [Anaerostipes caccae]|uniref:sugar-binding domain-containing protein n=1 Tax=Anaerostipes caccae TaxID=105841 RepID=UPI0002D33694|nr:sugar-binding domain-containing protein [Anaerostipes caccae]
MADEEEVRMLAEITRLYYEEEWTQQRIAKKFNMSRSLVSKLLSKARKIGIVEIIIHDEEFHPYRKLEEELKKRFQIKEAVCVSVENSEIPVKTVGAAAAKYLARKLSSVKYVAMTAGNTTRQIAENFSSGVPFDHVTFVPMSGGLGEERWEIQANVVCERMAKKQWGKQPPAACADCSGFS